MWTYFSSAVKFNIFVNIQLLAPCGMRGLSELTLTMKPLANLGRQGVETSPSERVDAFDDVGATPTPDIPDGSAVLSERELAMRDRVHSGNTFKALSTSSSLKRTSETSLTYSDSFENISTASSSVLTTFSSGHP